MSKGLRAKFYKSPAWVKTSKAYAKSVGNLCEKCRALGVISAGVIVHHKIHLTDENLTNTDISLDWGNLELLCRKCHAVEHPEVYGKNKKIKRRWEFADDGSVELTDD